MEKSMSGKPKHRIPKKFVEKLLKAPETHMGTQTISVWTTDGKRYDNVEVSGAVIIRIYGYSELPFKSHDISDLEVTHFLKPADYDPSKWIDLT
jgi:hypothetical protein